MTSAFSPSASAGIANSATTTTGTADHIGTVPLADETSAAIDQLFGLPVRKHRPFST
jgi:hypothetical protein